MNRYKTVFAEAEVERVIERSRFIARVKPVETRGDAESFISDIRSKNKDATHNVPAMIIGEKFELQWASDDGEPQGTAGAPIVQMLVREEITNIAVVVTRYFGGIKLGTGGLVRAYTGTVKAALSEAGACIVRDMSILTIKTDYAYLDKIQSIARNGEFEIREVLYEDTVTLKIASESENSKHVKAILNDVTAGLVVVVSEAAELVKNLVK